MKPHLDRLNSFFHVEVVYGEVNELVLSRLYVPDAVGFVVVHVGVVRAEYGALLRRHYDRLRAVLLGQSA